MMHRIQRGFSQGCADLTNALYAPSEDEQAGQIRIAPEMQ